MEGAPYGYVTLDALTQRSREGGRIVNVHVLVTVEVNAEGSREVLGVDIVTTEDSADWTAFLRSLIARCLSGVRLVVSDAHQHLKDAIAATPPRATWLRCRTHFPRKSYSGCIDAHPVSKPLEVRALAKAWKTTSTTTG